MRIINFLKKQNAKDKAQVWQPEIVPIILIALLAATIMAAAASAVISVILATIETFPSNMKYLIAEPKTIEDIIFNIASFMELGMMLLVGMFGVVIAGIQIAVLGFPAVVLGWHFKLIRWWSSTIIGFFLGCLPYTISELMQLKTSLSEAIAEYHWYGLWGITLLTGLSGAIAGFTFWFIWRLLLNKISNETYTE